MFKVGWIIQGHPLYQYLCESRRNDDFISYFVDSFDFICGFLPLKIENLFNREQFEPFFQLKIENAFYKIENKLGRFDPQK